MEDVEGQPYLWRLQWQGGNDYNADIHKGSRTIPHPELSADELVADLAGGAGRTPLEAAIRAWIDANPDDGETA